MLIHDDKLKELASRVLAIEAEAITHLATRIDDRFVRACQLMLACQGRIVVLGIGKSGHIGGKIAATLASTGTPAFFVHPAEASHGDMGMITAQDVVLALSNSGETDEILTLLPLIKRLGVPLIALTGNPASTLARTADVHLDVSVAQEACPLGLAPTSSTTATLAMGDALAVALLEARGFTAEDFARSHPGGRLGRRLLLLTDDVMHTGERMPRNAPDDLLKDALLEMSRKGLGTTVVVDDERTGAGRLHRRRPAPGAGSPGGCAYRPRRRGDDPRLQDHRPRHPGRRGAAKDAAVQDQRPAGGKLRREADRRAEHARSAARRRAVISQPPA